MPEKKLKKSKKKKIIIEKKKNKDEEHEMDIPGENKKLAKRLSGFGYIASELMKIKEVTLARKFTKIYAARRKFYLSGEPGREEFIKHLGSLQKEGFGKVDIIKMLMKFVSKNM